MHTPSAVIAESHRAAATLYVNGELTPEHVRDAIAYIEGLPAEVRAVCVDLRGVRDVPASGLRAVELALREWRAARRGVSRVKLADDAGAGMVAIRFAHRRWKSPPLREASPQEMRFSGRIRDRRRLS